VNEDAREQAPPSQPTSPTPTRKRYATPRLTRWGTIARLTQGDFSGPVPET
jgi:hypothetical protein